MSNTGYKYHMGVAVPIKAWTKGVPTNNTHDESIKHEKDGSYTVYDDFFGTTSITDIPTLRLARTIVKSLYEAERAGAEHYAMGEF